MKGCDVMKSKGPVPSIKDTYLFKTADKNGYLTKELTEMLTKGSIASPADLDHELSSINKYFKFANKVRVIKAFQDMDLILYYAPKGLQVKVPTSLPFITVKGKDNEPRVAVFIDNYVKFVNDNKISIEPIKLYCLMEAAYFAKEITHPGNNVLISEGSSIFAHMFARVLNKAYALNTDKTVFNKIIFLASKFFILNHLNYRDDETVFNYAAKNCNSASIIALKEVNDLFPEEAFADIATFIQTITKNYYYLMPSFEKLTVRGYIESFTGMYGQASVFALEHINYFRFVIISAINGAYLLNQYALEDILEKSGAKLYNAFTQ